MLRMRVRFEWIRHHRERMRGGRAVVVVLPCGLRLGIHMDSNPKPWAAAGSLRVLGWGGREGGNAMSS